MRLYRCCVQVVRRTANGGRTSFGLPTFYLEAQSEHDAVLRADYLVHVTDPGLEVHPSCVLAADCIEPPIL